MVKVNFLRLDFSLKFAEPCLADTNPLFILRSMLGKNLRSMCCISKRSASCADCQFFRTCAYAFLFETILPAGNSALPGRSRASHPFSLSSKIQFKNYRNPLDEYPFAITLFGKAADYLPYIYAAFVRSGQNGLFKSRTQFKVESVSLNGKNILIDENHLDLDFAADEWKCGFADGRHVEKSETSHNGEILRSVQNDKICVQNDSEILVSLKSPLRFKVQGKYTADFSAEDFMNCIFRRARTLCSLYGEISEEEKNLWKISAGGIQITERNLRWEDERHYSSRQKTAMDLGGVSGTFKMEGNFTQEERALLDFAESAGAGKNTNFGLGQVEVWER